VIGKYGSYTYPFLPVGVSWHDFRRMFAFWADRFMSDNLRIVGLAGFQR